MVMIVKGEALLKCPRAMREPDARRALRNAENTKLFKRRHSDSQIAGFPQEKMYSSSVCKTYSYSCFTTP